MEIVVRTENELNFNWFKKGISSDLILLLKKFQILEILNFLIFQKN